MPTVGQELVVGVNVALIQQGLEYVVGYGLVIARIGMSEQVEGYAQLFPRLQKHGMVAVHDLGWSNPFLVGADGYRGAVGVAARHHQHTVSLETVIAGKDVCGQIASSDMAQVQGAVGVGPGYGDKNALSHGANPYRPKAQGDKNPQNTGVSGISILA